MDIPRFDSASVNPRLMQSGIGDAFQEFVHQILLPEFPQLHRFPGGGKDGAIDLIDTSNRVVVECKFAGDDDYSTIESRWTAVKKLLEKHLSDPKGPTLGQSQYGPWYSQDAFAEYWFCFSGIISNQQQRLNLHKSIAGFFSNLASQRPHLSHLQNLKVEIVDWTDLTTRLDKQAHLIFRWFPRTRPSGLVPIDESVDAGTFRTYLTNAKLPYYSLAEHLSSTPAPNGTAILDEETLLSRFDSPEITGLVITGKGGVGKSRLTLELGWLGLRKGWSVMRVQSRLREDALDRFAERLTPDATALLLVDYIETQSDFGELVETINVLNDSGVARLRYVAACRTNYYYQAIAASGRHLPVDLTPPPGSTVQDWFARYRQKTIERILAEAGLPGSEEYLKICHNVPILAVFLAYLHTSGRAQDLADLVDETEFGRWVSKRVQLTFPGRSISRELAHLIPLFPMDDSAAARLPQNVYGSIFDRLATDGWVEKVPASVPEAPASWVTAHDVLADQILLSYVRSIPNTAEKFIGELFAFAGEVQCLSSALVSLQRISDTAPLNTIGWRKIITDAIASNLTSWRDVRDLLIRTTLLSVPDCLSLLRSHEQLWTDAETDLGFQKSLGWLARWVATQVKEAVAAEDKNALLSWVAKATPFAERSNFVITWGLRLAPEMFKGIALSWIVARPTLLQTHYLMVAWLDCGLEPDAIASFVRQWCQRFSQNFHLSFLVQAWLEAGGERTVVEDAIKIWLVEHRANAEARFVYEAWLDAGGGKELVQAPINDWLAEHRTDAEARFVYDAWLDADGEKGIVEEAIKDWLVAHRGTAEASHVYKPWLDAGGQKGLVRDAIQDWLVENRGDVEAQFVFEAWLNAGGEKELVQEAVKDWLAEHRSAEGAQFVYDAWLNAGGQKELVGQAIKDWLIKYRKSAVASHVYASWLDAGGEKELVREAIKDWLVEHRGATEAQFVYDAWLDAGGEKELVEEAIKDWLIEHRGDSEARFVYTAWLDARGERALVKDALKDWLSLHGEDIDADYVFRSWLEAGGERGLVWDAAIAWLAQHREEESAVYVTKFIAKQPNLPVTTIRDVLVWCRTFAGHEDALWRLTQLRHNLLLPEVAEDVVLASEATVTHLLHSTNVLGPTTRGQITVVIFTLIVSPAMKSGPLRERVDSLFVRSLNHPFSFGRGARTFSSVQRNSFVQRFSELMTAGMLDPEADREDLRRFVEWVDEWDTEAKQDARRLFDELRARYPIPGLWEIVRFE